MLQRRFRVICRFPPITRRDLRRVRFVNKTPFDVELVQLTSRSNVNPMCNPHKLESGCHMDMEVYSKSSWIGRKLATKDDLNIDGKEVFVPTSALTPLSPDDITQRQELAITVPLRSLKRASLLVVKNCLLNVKDVETLGLPRTLTEKLRQLVRESVNCQTDTCSDWDTF